MTDPTNALPLDESSRQSLATVGLRYALVDTDDSAEHDRWLQADHRGFHFDALTVEQLAEYRLGLAGTRSIGVWDATAAEPDSPVATVGSWRSSVSLPGGRSLEAWAISAVSVAATHRRRGIASALLEGELRAAQAAGVPVAALTVSEATIYGRWGFGPAAYTADYRIDTRGLRLTRASPSGRVHRVDAPALRASAPGIAERSRERTAGEVPVDELRWNRMFAISARTADHARRLRAARYDDAEGEPQGFVLYSLREDAADFAAHTLTVEYLCAATDDAYVALWHYVLNQDLVSTVVASLRPVDEPLPWLVSNPRAVQTTERREHLWLRILDVPAALGARRFAHAETVLLRVTDPLGFAHGAWMLVADRHGRATVTAVDSGSDSGASASPAEAGVEAAVIEAAITQPAVIGLGVEALGALLLGGTPVEALRLAGRLVEGTPGAAQRLDSLLHTSRAAHLSTWF